MVCITNVANAYHHHPVSGDYHENGSTEPKKPWREKDQGVKRQARNGSAFFLSGDIVGIVTRKEFENNVSRLMDGHYWVLDQRRRNGHFIKRLRRKWTQAKRNISE